MAGKQKAAPAFEGDDADCLIRRAHAIVAVLN